MSPPAQPAASALDRPLARVVAGLVVLLGAVTHAAPGEPPAWGRFGALAGILLGLGALFYGGGARAARLGRSRDVGAGAARPPAGPSGER